MALTAIQRLRLWLTRTKTKLAPGKSSKTKMTFQDTAMPGAQAASTVMMSGIRLVFGLEWNPIAAGVDIEEALQDARNAGFNYSALVADGSQVGLAREIGSGKGKLYSAALMMVEQLSSAEVEVYIFELGQQVCFIGLVDGKPITGFDLLLPGMDEALAVLAEFRSMHVGHEIRMLTNVQNVLPNAEQIRLDGMLSLLGPHLMVKRLINRGLRRAVGTAVVVVLVLAGTVAWYLYEQAEERQRQEEAARIAQESDPDYIYELAITGLLSNAGSPGNHLLQQWREMLAALPLVHKGWLLTNVECRAIGCKATWKRVVGNFSDFDQHQPTNAIDVPELAPAGIDDLLKITLETHHQLPTEPIGTPSHDPKKPAAGLDRQNLPQVRDATLQWGSLLQDWSLLDVRAKLGKPALFGPPGLTDPNPIKKPVMMLAWEIEDGIWSLPAVDLPDDVIADSLKVTISGKDSKYKLIGGLYAKAKKF